MYQNLPMYRAKDAIRDQMNISFFSTNYEENYLACPMHWHDYYSLDIIAEGSGIHHINGKDVLVKTGDVTLTTPTDIHAYSCENRLITHSVLFTDSAVLQKYRYIIQSARSVSLSGDEQLAAVMHMSEINKSNLILKSHPDAQLEKDTVSLNFCLLLLLFAKKAGKTNPVTTNNVTELIQYLNMHFREPLTIEKAAKVAGLTPAYFSVWFKKHVGMAYIDYINDLRIDYAVSLIKQGHTILDSCYASGFGSLSNFNHTFKKKLGVTPKQYKI